MSARDGLIAALDAAGRAHGSALRRALYGTTDVGIVAGRLLAVVEEELGEVESTTFVRTGVGLVAGFGLADGRAVVLKVHRWNVTMPRLGAVQDVQAALAAAGLPAPPPIGRPRPSGSGIATLEEHRAGEPADGHRPEIRRAVAAGLAALIEAGRAIDPLPDVGRDHLDVASGVIWPEPHDLRFDFEATAEGAEWIDAIAVDAAAVLGRHRLPPVVAHLDWRVENLGFRGDRIVAIYDWDSIVLAPEAVAVGHAAASFPTDWGRVGFGGLPSVEEMRAFVADYEEARGGGFDDAEREVIEAANLRLCAHGARCQHSDAVRCPDLAAAPDAGWTGLLRVRSAESLW